MAAELRHVALYGGITVYAESLNSIMDIKIINKSLKAIRIVLVNTTKLNPNSYVFENKITPSRDQW